MSAVVRGLSWDHPRGHAPLVAASDAWAHARGGVRVEWTPRSLADFGGGELSRYLGEFDLVACDYPLIGRAVAEGWLQPLNGIADVFAGPSHASYTLDGQLWAAPVDAAALTFARRPDLLPEPPSTFAELLDLAGRTGRVAVPLSLFSAVALYATFCAEADVDPFGHSPGRRHALDRMAELAPHTTRRGSVDLLRTMATSDELLAVAWPYGYSTYSLAGAFGHRIAFTDPPSSVPGRPARPTLGGVGLGLLTGGPAPEVAGELLRHLVGQDAQRGLYTTSGGQPALAAAWDDPGLDRAVLGFFTGTRTSLENAYVRPNAAWYDHAQPRIGAVLQEFTAGERVAAATLSAMDDIVKAVS
ncbi:extracellular solute-binding protein [Streptomyces sp. NPDC058576]|uniref:extracellular solute-binding protein n=1 Tax=Streptomyces sp. NPDC058576 TaxID=3346547 RepID=UPI00365E94F7